MTFFKGIFQVVKSADLRDVTFIFKLCDVFLEFSLIQLSQICWFRTDEVQRARRLNLHIKLLI